MQLRDAHADDVLLIQKLAHEIWWPTYTGIISKEQIAYMLEEMYNPLTLTQQMAQEGRVFLLAYENGNASAFASFGGARNPPSVTKIQKLYVHPSMQKSGMGRGLLNHIASRVEKTSRNILQLNVNRNNPARHFYEKHGFSIIGEEDIPIGPFLMQDYVMQKKLPA